MESSVVDYVPVYQHNANYPISNATSASHVDQTTNNNTKYGKCEHSTSLWKLKPALQYITREVLKLAVEFLVSGILMLVVLSRVVLVLTVSCAPCIRGILILF
jgi:hypothetical protein